MTAEFVVVLPVVLIVLSLIIGAILLVTQRLTLTAAASEVARLEARGDLQQSSDRISNLPHGVTLERSQPGGLWCVTMRSSGAEGVLSALTVTARGCAARTGGVS